MGSWVDAIEISQCGGFSTASAYEVIMGHHSCEDNWSWIWKIRLPQKRRGFLWLLFHGKLLTNLMRLRRGLTSVPTCPNCCGVEDMDHLFRHYFKAKEVWLALCGRTWCRNMFSLSWNDWLLSNSKNKKPFNEQATWSSVIIITSWKIWKNKNVFVFKKKLCNGMDSVKFILDCSRDIDLAFNLSIINSRPAFRLIQWMLPPAGKIKLNVDGNRKLGGGGGFGGVFRDERGVWVCGHYGRLDSGTSLEAELWALYKGLTVMLQKRMHEVIIETDAKQVVQLMEDATDDKFPFKGLLEDAKIIFRGCECTIHHIYKEGNLCADALAKFRAEQPEDILVVNDPP